MTGYEEKGFADLWHLSNQEVHIFQAQVLLSNVMTLMPTSFLNLILSTWREYFNREPIVYGT